MNNHNPSAPTRIGILLVHGSGVKRPFEHLEEVVKNIQLALNADESLKMYVETSLTSPQLAYIVQNQAWDTDSQAPVVITIEDIQGRVTELHFSEVWWGDVRQFNESLETQMNFWNWLFSLWARENRLYTLYNRFSLFLTVQFVLLTQPVLSFFNFLLTRFLGFTALNIGSFERFLKDIKLFFDNKSNTTIFSNLAEVPRVKIRKQMIEALVNMSLRDYDQWFILSHSLGTVVALNALMETEQELPNYLSKTLWQRWYQSSKKKASVPLTEEEHSKRPPWLEKDDMIDRTELFAQLRGFMTYGSILSIFAGFFPAIVPFNKDESVFRQDFEWINVYDPTDPFADKIKYHNLKTPFSRSPQPKEICYKADSLSVLSHNNYLTYNKWRRNSLVNQLVLWLLGGNSFQTPSTSWGWPDEKLIKYYTLIKFIVLFLFSFQVLYLIEFSMASYLNEILENKLIWQLVPLYITLNVIVTLIMGILFRLRIFIFASKNRGERSIPIYGQSIPPKSPEDESIKLEKARNILNEILPPEEPKKVGKIHFMYRYNIATSVSGDYARYHVEPKNNGVSFCMVDVEGHGIDSATYARDLHRLLQKHEEWGTYNPCEALEKADKWIREDYPKEKDLPAFCMNFTKIDITQMKLCYANAGMPSPLLFRPRKTEPQKLEAHGLYIGLGYSDCHSKKKEVDIETGDILVIYSDGITEAVNNQGKLFGISGIRKAVIRNNKNSPAQIADRIITEANKHSGRGKPKDDQALIVILIEA